MPSIYDPRKPNSTGGKAVIAKRSSRRRKKTSSSSSSSSRVEEAKKKGDVDNGLDFFSDSMSVGGNDVQQQQKQPATKSVGIKDKDNNQDRPSKKIATVPKTSKTTSTQTQRPVNFQPIQSQRAIAVDTRFLDSNDQSTTSNGASYSDLVADNIQQLLQSANDRGLDPCIVAWTELQQQLPASTSETRRSKADVIRVRSTLVDSSNNCQDFPGVPIHSAPSKDGNDTTFHIPKLLSAYVSWDLFGDFGTLFLRRNFL